MKVSFRIGGRPSAELASKTPEEALRKQSAARQMGAGQCLCRVRIRDRSRSDRLLHFSAQCRHETLSLSPQSVERT